MKSIGTKVTDEEYAEFERTAVARPWANRGAKVMLASANRHAPKSPPSGGSEAKVLMAENVALRTILLSVLFEQANGESLAAKQMQKLIELADADKLKKAGERLRSGS